MGSRLDRITDLEERAVRCEYSVHKLARDLGVSERELRWYFQHKRRVKPKHWLDALRASKVLEYLKRGESLKAAAAIGKFKQSSHCSNFVKRVTGNWPTKQ